MGDSRPPGIPPDAEETVIPAVNHGGKEFLLTANVSSAHKAEIDTIITSVTFQK